MKSVVMVRSPKKKQPEYPCLMQSKADAYVILMFTYRKGVVVGNPTPDVPIGTHSDAWAMNCFEPFVGDVTLSSEE